MAARRDVLLSPLAPLTEDDILVSVLRPRHPFEHLVSR